MKLELPAIVPMPTLLSTKHSKGTTIHQPIFNIKCQKFPLGPLKILPTCIQSWIFCSGLELLCQKPVGQWHLYVQPYLCVRCQKGDPEDGSKEWSTGFECKSLGFYSPQIHDSPKHHQEKSLCSDFGAVP